MSGTDVLIERHGDVAHVVLNRADRANSLNAAAAQAVGRAVEEASDARVVLLTGAGRAFCAGGDLDELER